ncbi:MAG: hypothetical protein C5B49_16345, partial [Bdellovibrio sp.]
ALKRPDCIFSAIADPEMAQFHELTERFPSLEILPIQTARVFDVALRIGQPFRQTELRRLSERALFNFYFMLDTIALDCFYIAFTKELDAMWEFVARYSDGVIFNSEFTRQRFNFRFPSVAEIPQLACLHSLSPADYVEAATQASDRVPLARRRILVVGNGYAHKFVKPTAQKLADQVSTHEIRVLGLGENEILGAVCMPSGRLSENRIQEEYRNSEIVVFPSHLEGFGFPVVQALSHGKAVFARDNPVNRELATQWKGGGSLHLYENTGELIDRLNTLSPSVGGAASVGASGTSAAQVGALGTSAAQVGALGTSADATGVQGKRRPGIAGSWSWQSAASALIEFIERTVQNDGTAEACMRRSKFFALHDGLNEPISNREKHYTGENAQLRAVVEHLQASEKHYTSENTQLRAVVERLQASEQAIQASLQSLQAVVAGYEREHNRLAYRVARKVQSQLAGLPWLKSFLLGVLSIFRKLRWVG